MVTKFTLSIFIIVIVFFISLSYTRCITDSQSHLNLARTAIAANNGDLALKHLGQAILSRSPWNFAAESAAREVHSWLQDPKFSSSNREKSLWELRSAIFGSRSFIDKFDTRYMNLANEIDRELLKLGASTTQGALTEKLITTPRYFYQIISQITFVAWILSVFLLIWKGFTIGGRPRPAILPLSLGSISLYCLWLASIYAN